MMNFTKLGSLAHAESYYDHDDYYRESGEAPSQWLGSGSDRLNLSGEVNRERFAELLRGKIADGSEIRGRNEDGVFKRTPGWEATFSAPKSVSLAALVGGDHRLLEAHDKAVREAFEWLEENVAQTRIREGNEFTRERTGNLIGASFRHSTSRELDPNLHTHSLIVNATQDKTGKWRALHSREFYRVQYESDRVYKQALARQARELGYDVERTEHGFELTGFANSHRDEFSDRSKNMDEWLERRGLTRETASRAMREKAALATRKSKQKDVDREAMKADWREREQELGVDSRSIVEAAKGRSADRQAIQKEAAQSAASAVESAAKSLGGRQSRFTKSELEREALRFAFGSSATNGDIKEAMAKSEKDNRLMPRRVNTDNGQEVGYTTLEAIRYEYRMLSAEKAGRGQAEPLKTVEEAMSVVERAEAESVYPWTQGQKDATAGIMATDHRITAVQGYAGTAKTTTVLKTIAAEAQAQGYTVKGMAPTKSAAEQLADGANIAQSETVAAHLVKTRSGHDEASKEKELWVVDEASMLSAKDTQELLRASESANARVVLVGDVQQLGSVEAGEAFRQLQENGMETFVLNDIVRQQNADTREAVYASIEGDISRSMQAIERSGSITEISDDGQRRDAIVGHYLSMDEGERAQTVVMDPTRAGRHDFNERIREGLKAEGTIYGEEIQAETLEKKDLDPEQTKDASRYKRGDQVTFSRDYQKAGIQKGEYYEVDRIDYKSQTVHLKDREGNTAEWRPKQFGNGKKVQAYEKQDAKIAAGDQIQWTKNDKDRGLNNGDRLTVERVDKGTIYAKDARGKAHTIDPQQKGGKHFRHAYASTVHGTQGLEGKEVIPNIDSKNMSLIDQRSFYTTISRAKIAVHIYTDSRKGIERIASSRSGEKQTALESVKERQEARTQEKNSPDKQKQRNPSDKKAEKTTEKAKDQRSEKERDQEGRDGKRDEKVRDQPGRDFGRFRERVREMGR